MYLDHIGGGGPLHGIDCAGDQFDPVTGREINSDVIRIAVVDRLVVRSGDVPSVRIAGAGHLVEWNPSLPLMVAGPSGHGQPAVEPVAERYFTPDQVSDVSRDVGEDQIVAWVHPFPHRLGQFVGVAGNKHPAESIWPGGWAISGGVSESQPRPGDRVAGDDGAVMSVPRR